MRKGIKCTGWILVMFVMALTCTAKPSSRHNIKINPGDPLVLAENGKANVEIVVPEPASPVARFAAKELKTFLDQALGSDIKILRERSGATPAIMLGDNAWSRSWGVNAATMPQDAFAIKRVADVIIIAGRDAPYDDPERYAPFYERATLFGVYDFLERFAGVRFYFPGETGTVVPKLKELKIPQVEIYEEPDFILRDFQWDVVRWYHPFKDDATRIAEKMTEYYRLRGRTQRISSAHGLSRLGLVERFGTNHPEYFALKADGKTRDTDLSENRGHLCLSNPGLKEEIYRDAAAYLTGKPASFRGALSRKIAAWDSSCFFPGHFDCMPQDGLGKGTWCHCPECRAYLEKENPGELVWQFVAELAGRLQNNHIPGKIANGAYDIYAPVPKCDLPDNVTAAVCALGPYNEKFPKQQAKADQLICDWNAKLKDRKVWLWNYMNYVPDGVPALSFKYLSSYYKRVGPHISGAFINDWEAYFPFEYLNWYVFSRLAWDNGADVDALLKEHHAKMFGPAAGPMGEFFKRLEDMWITKGLGEAKDTPLGPVMVMPTETDLWERIYDDAVMAGFGKLFDEAEKLAAADADSLKRVQFFRDKFLGEMIRVRDKYFGRKKEIEDLVFEITPAPPGEVITVDGAQTEAAWAKAEQVALVPRLEDKEQNVLARTVVKALWSPDCLYLVFDCAEDKINNLSVDYLNRDDGDLWRDSSVEVFLNPSGDRANYYHFIVNAKGIVSDTAWKTNKDGVKTSDGGWNCGVQAATQIGTNGWVAEIAIPLKELLPEGGKAGLEFPANFNRGRNLKNINPDENQYYSWSPFLRGSFHDLPRFGKIRLVDKKTPSSSLIRNGSFEEGATAAGLKYWFAGKEDMARGTVRLDTDTYREGCRSIMIRHGLPEASAKEEDFRTDITQYSPDMQADTRYLLTCFIRTEKVEGPGGAGLQVFIGPGFNSFFPPTPYRGTMPWTKVGFEFQAPPDTNKTNAPPPYLRLCLNHATGTVWFDDVRLRAMP